MDEDRRWIESELARLGVEVHAPLLPRRESIRLADGRESGLLRWDEAPAEVLYLHGAGQNAHTWDLVAAIVGAPAVAVDLPGHGHSSWRPDRDYRPTSNAAAVAETLAATGDRPRVVVGMSLGGLTAIALTATLDSATLDSAAPDQTVPDPNGSLVLVDILPGVRAERPDRRRLGQVGLIDGVREFASFDELLATTVAASTNRSVESLRRGVRHNAVETPAGTWRWRYDDLASGRMLDDVDLWPALAALRRPTTLVKGGASPLLTDELLERFARERPDADLVVAPDAGHAVQSEAPLLLAAIIARHRATGLPA